MSDCWLYLYPLAAATALFGGLSAFLTVRLRSVQKSLQQEQGRTAAILGAAVDGIVTIGEHGQVESFNPAAERLFGYRAQEVIGKNVKMLMPEPYHSEHDGYLTRYRASGEAHVIGIGREVVGRCKNGTTFPMELSVGETKDGGRRLFAGIIRDITERKRAAQQLEDNEAAARVTLEKAVADAVERERATKGQLEDCVAELSAVARRVAAGDLAARADIDPRGEFGLLGVNLNQMTESLERLVTEIRGAVGNLSSASDQILSATKQQVAATSEEVTAVRQTAATVAELRQAAEAAARKTRVVAELAQKVEATAEDGQRAVEESIHGSEEAKERMEALAERILAFSEQAEAIAEINSAVGELAEQSNLLAVNAGIEAAKAGEAGKGFSVVASEVKGLAERSKEATSQVRRIVKDIQKSAQATVMAAEQGVKAAEAGTGLGQRSGAAIGQLTEKIAAASDAAQQIMAMSEQQQAGMDQIALAMQNIEHASTQTAAATQQVERASRGLDQLARKLAQIVGMVAAEAP